jgi:hypothetical protein
LTGCATATDRSFNRRSTAVLEEDGCWGTVSFTNFFSLVHIDGAWTIVNKTFAHTGGEPPPM